MLLVLSVCLLFGWFCSSLAAKKGREPIAWFFLGFAFGIFGLATIWLLPSLDAENKKSSTVIDVNPIAESPAEDQWYYLNASHEQIGPIPLQEIRELLQTGKIIRSTYLWRPGMNTWTHAEELRNQIEIDKK